MKRNLCFYLVWKSKFIQIFNLFFSTAIYLESTKSTALCGEYPDKCNIIPNLKSLV